MHGRVSIPERSPCPRSVTFTQRSQGESLRLCVERGTDPIRSVCCGFQGDSTRGSSVSRGAGLSRALCAWTCCSGFRTTRERHGSPPGLRPGPPISPHRGMSRSHHLPHPRQRRDTPSPGPRASLPWGPQVSLPVCKRLFPRRA